jgi:hypothetical protein
MGWRHCLFRAAGGGLPNDVTAWHVRYTADNLWQELTEILLDFDFQRLLDKNRKDRSSSEKFGLFRGKELERTLDKLLARCAC